MGIAKILNFLRGQIEYKKIHLILFMYVIIFHFVSVLEDGFTSDDEFLLNISELLEWTVLVFVRLCV